MALNKFHSEDCSIPECEYCEEKSGACIVMAMPGERLYVLVEELSHADDKNKRREINSRILEILYSYARAAVKHWKSRNGYRRISGGKDGNEYLTEICLILYRRLLRWVHKDMERKPITSRYLLTTATFILADILRRDRRDESREIPSSDIQKDCTAVMHDNGPGACLRNPEQIILCKETAKIIWRRLTEIQQTIVLKVMNENRSLTEIAELLDVSVSTVSRDLKKVRQIIREEMRC